MHLHTDISSESVELGCCEVFVYFVVPNLQADKLSAQCE
jgi:hypothetical protein